MIPPFAIVQARIGSARLPRKMLLPLAGRPLVWHAWNAAVEAFGEANVVVAIPASEENDRLAKVCAEFGATLFRWDGPEEDVLGRFHACAHRYRWMPDSVIVRITPDDPRKDVLSLRRVANGERLPVELGGEAFTLDMLDRAYDRASYCRVVYNADTEEMTTEGGGPVEHLTDVIFPTPPPPHPPGVWTVDTPEDYEAMKRIMEP